VKPLDQGQFFCALEVRPDVLLCASSARFILTLLIQTFHYYHPSGAAPLGTPGLATFCSPLPRWISDRSNSFMRGLPAVSTPSTSGISARLSFSKTANKHSATNSTEEVS
jgi:hypothetical protein